MAKNACAEYGYPGAQIIPILFLKKYFPDLYGACSEDLFLFARFFLALTHGKQIGFVLNRKDKFVGRVSFPKEPSVIFADQRPMSNLR